MKQIFKEVTDEVFTQHKAQVDEAIKKAVDATFNQHKPINEQFFSEMGK